MRWKRYSSSTAASTRLVGDIVRVGPVFDRDSPLLPSEDGSHAVSLVEMTPTRTVSLVAVGGIALACAAATMRFQWLTRNLRALTATCSASLNQPADSAASLSPSANCSKDSVMSGIEREISPASGPE